MINNSHFLISLCREKVNLDFFDRKPDDIDFSSIKQYSGIKYQLFEWLVSEEKSLKKSCHFEDNDLIVLITGVFYNYLNTNELINYISEFTVNNVGNKLNNISGSFCGFIYNKNTKELISFTDRLGVQKLFFIERKNEVIVSSSLELLKNFCNEIVFDLEAFSTTILLSHIINNTIIKGIKQIDAGCYRIHSLRKQIEYLRFPKRLSLSSEKAIAKLNEAFNNYFERIKPFVDNDIGLFMSRGKDCRILLKYLMDNHIKFKYYSFYRDNSSLEPFVCFSLKSIDDYQIAHQIAKSNNIKFHSLKIDNNYMLENLDFLIKFNQGTPLHWEFNAAAKRLYKDGITYMITGFMGDPFAGKNKHRYLFNDKIKSKKEYAQFSFKFSAPQKEYEIIRIFFKKYNFDLFSFSQIEETWTNKYEIINSSDLDNIYIFGLTRTRGIGRVIPTFHQASSHSIPLYPYLDNEIMNAYLCLPDKSLQWERTHLDLIANDNRFNKFKTTRLAVSAKTERMFLNQIGLIRKFIFFKEKFMKTKIINNQTYNNALFNELIKFANYPQDLWDEIINYKYKTKKYYQLVSNIIEALRINANIEGYNGR